MDEQPSFPPSIAVETLLKKNPIYNADKLKKYRVIYKAGEAFRETIDDFLVKRQIEDASSSCGGVCGKSQYEARKKVAWYVPRGSGLIDWLVAAVFKKDVDIVAEKDPKGFWEALNDDVDGMGTTTGALCRSALREIMIHGRAYFAVNFVEPMAIPGKNETLDARIKVLTAEQVDDWDEDEDGNLLWVRTNRVIPVRTNPWEQPTKEKWMWTYITATEICTYWAEKEIDKEFDRDSVATAESIPHDFGRVPVFPIRAKEEIHVMDRIFDPLVALFNREVSITWALNQQAYALLVLKLSQTDISHIVASELAALKIGTEEDALFISPNPEIFNGLFQDSDRLKKSLYEVIQALALNAMASQTQNARQSAAAKQIDNDPLQTLLASFAWPIRDALEELVDSLKAYRGENTEIEIEGMDHFDATLKDAEAVVNSQDGPPKTGPKPKPEEKEKVTDE